MPPPVKRCLERLKRAHMQVYDATFDRPAKHAKDGDPIAPGQIDVAPPAHHMVIEPGRISLTKGPRKDWARPAIDPLFRSAADRYGPDVIGVILTGSLNDGTAGLYHVARAGVTPQPMTISTRARAG